MARHWGALVYLRKSSTRNNVIMLCIPFSPSSKTCFFDILSEMTSRFSSEWRNVVESTHFANKTNGRRADCALGLLAFLCPK